MKQEFVTLYGKIIIENDKLFIRSFYLPFYQTAFIRILIELSWIVAFFLVLIFPQEGAKGKAEIVLFGLMAILRLPFLYDVFLKRSYSNRIALNRIKSFTVEEDNFGLRISVRLHLVNGRYKKINFRKLENQSQPFIELLSQHIVQLQFA